MITKLLTQLYILDQCNIPGALDFDVVTESCIAVDSSIEGVVSFVVTDVVAKAKVTIVKLMFP